MKNVTLSISIALALIAPANARSIVDFNLINQRPDIISSSDEITNPGWYFWICRKDPYQSSWYGPYVSQGKAERAWRQGGSSRRFKSGVRPSYYLDSPDSGLSCP